MKKALSAILAAAFIFAAMITTQAQPGARLIGNRPRDGKANSSFTIAKGNQVGIKMNAGRKPVQLLELNFDAQCYDRDSLKFKVNVYKLTDGPFPGENLVTQPVYGAVTKGRHNVSVDLSPYNIVASGHILVAIEWLQSSASDNQFAVGLFNGGTWYYEYSRWKKVPVIGADFNVAVRRVK